MGFYILWNPDAPMPPRVKFSSRAEASRVCRNMAAEHKQRFYVLEAVEYAEIQQPVVTTVLDRKEDNCGAVGGNASMLREDR